MILEPGRLSESPRMSFLAVKGAFDRCSISSFCIKVAGRLDTLGHSEVACRKSSLVSTLRLFLHQVQYGGISPLYLLSWLLKWVFRYSNLNFLS